MVNSANDIVEFKDTCAVSKSSFMTQSVVEQEFSNPQQGISFHKLMRFQDYNFIVNRLNVSFASLDFMMR